MPWCSARSANADSPAPGRFYKGATGAPGIGTQGPQGATGATGPQGVPGQACVGAQGPCGTTFSMISLTETAANEDGNNDPKVTVVPEVDLRRVRRHCLSESTSTARGPC